MGDKIILNVEKREATGKQAAKLRREGLVPGVVYGNKFDATNIQLSQQEARGVVARAGRHTPVELKIGAKKTMALIKSVDYIPARSDITHVSFQAVRADEVVTTEVPLVLVGADESVASRAGLIILPTIEDVEVRAKTADLPEKLAVNAAGLAEHGDKLTLANIELPSGVELTEDDLDIVVASVYEPAALEAKNAAADAAADEERAEGDNAAENVPSDQAETAEETK